MCSARTILIAERAIRKMPKAAPLRSHLPMAAHSARNPIHIHCSVCPMWGAAVLLAGWLAGMQRIAGLFTLLEKVVAQRVEEGRRLRSKLLLLLLCVWS